MMSLSRIKDGSILAFLAVIVFVIYANALFNHFVWDDGYLIVNNPYVKDWKFLPQLFSGDLVQSTAMRDMPSGYYRPLSMLWFMADYHLWGLKAFGFHLTNVLVHLANCILIYFLVARLSADKAVGFLTALLFAVHPIHVEAVTPIYNRMGIQAALFMLSALVCFVYADGFKKRGMLVAALVSLGLALFSKEEAVVLPVLFVMYDRFFLRGGGSGKTRLIFYSSCALIVLSYLSIRAANVDYRFLSANTKQLWGMTLADNGFWHVLTAVKIVMLYAVKTLWPYPLSPVYWIDPVKGILEPLVLGGILSLMTLLWAFWRMGGTKRDGAFFILFFLLTVIPFSNIMPIAEVYTFRERFAYLPSLSICFAAAVFCLKFKLKRLWFMLPVFAVLLWAAKTVEVNYVWRNNLTLWRYAVEKEPQSQLALLNLGDTYMAMGRSEEALDEFQKSLAVGGPKALSSIYLTRLNIAAIFIDQGKHDEALRELQESVGIAKQIKLNPASAYDKLGLLHVSLNQPQKAEEYFSQAIFYSENFLPSRYNLAVLYYSQRRYAQAEAQLLKAVVDPDFTEAQYLLGITLLAQGRRQEAKNIFERIKGFTLAQKQLQGLQ